MKGSYITKLLFKFKRLSIKLHIVQKQIIIYAGIETYWRKKMPSKRFGEFLIKKNVIDANALVEVLHIQGTRSIMQLGEIAVKNKILTPEQLLEILNVQSSIDERFESIALLLGYLDQDEIDKLVDLQVNEKQMIGEILITQNKMTQDQLDLLLEEFQTV